MADGDLYLSDSPNVDTGLVEQDGQLHRSVLTAVPSGTLSLSDSPNVSTGYVTDSDGKKHKVNLTAEVTGSLELSDNVNADTGYVIDGDGKKHKVKLTAVLHGGGGGSATIEELNVTPSTSAQVITATSGTDGYSPVNVAAVTSAIDANITSGNIKSGVSILGVSGNVVELNGTTTTINPSTSLQTVTPTSPSNGFTSVTVPAVTSSIDANITAGNIKKDVQILGVTGTYEGSGGGGKYQLLQRVTDDSNNEIGTVCGFHTDANNVEYAVVCLDAQYRLASGQYLSSKETVTGLALVNTAGLLWEDTDTATSNCDKIIDFIGDGSTYTSSGVSHCRSKSFVIDGTTYYGQLPTGTELVDIFELLSEINNADTSASQYPALIIPTAGNAWSSTQYNNQNAWHIAAGLNTITKTQPKFIIPVLELPNA